MSKTEQNSDNPQTGNSSLGVVVNCCYEYPQRGNSRNEIVDCQSKAVVMLKCGSYDSKKFHPFCKRHAEMFRKRVAKVKRLWNIDLVHEERPLQ